MVWVSGFGTHSKGPEEASATCQLVGETTLKFTLTKAPAGTNYSSNEYLIEVVNANNPSERVSTGRVADKNWTTAGDTSISGPEGSYWDTGETIYITLPDSVKGNTVSYTVEVAGTTIASGDMYIP